MKSQKRAKLAMAENQELDFVCNEWVLCEKQKSNQISRGMVIGAISVVCGLFLVGFLVAWGSIAASTIDGWTMSMEQFLYRAAAGWQQASIFYLLAPYVLLGVSFCCMLFTIATRKEFPTNIRMNDSGFWLAWMRKHARRSPLIPWSSVTQVSAKRTGNFRADDPTAGVVVSFSIDKKSLPWFLAGRLELCTSALWRQSFLTPLFQRDLILDFPLDSLTLDADRHRLLSAIKSRMPSSKVSDDFHAVCDSGNVPTFTKLWLDDMQSFRRTRADELVSGTLLQEGRYEVRNKIATGGQAKIYSAFDTHLRCMVAVKELVLPINAGADVRNRSFANVKNEAALLSKLTHPGIVKLLDNFVEDHRAYLVLEHIEGTSLRTLVKDQGALAPEVVARVATQICDFLDYIHSQSPPVVHRDLTPDNLMIMQDGTVRLLDFNVAQQLESASTKTVVGKHNYMAPEQFKGKPTTQSDLYSLGCTLYYLLVAEDPTPLSCSHPKSHCENVLLDMDDLVAKLTELDSSKRYACAKDVSADLQKLFDAPKPSESSADASQEEAAEKLNVGGTIKVPNLKDGVT